MPIGNFSYNPGVVSTVGETHARSNGMLGQALMALMQGLSNNEEKAKTELSQGKAADAWWTALGEEAPKTTGMSEAMWKAMAPRDKWGAFQGVNQAQATQRVLADLSKQRQEQAATEASRKAMSEAGRIPLMEALNRGQGPINPERPVTGATLLQAMSNNPDSINAAHMPQMLMTALESMQGKPGAGRPEGAEINGVPVIFNASTGAFVVDPKYKAQMAAQASAANRTKPGEVTPAMEWQDLARQELSLRREWANALDKAPIETKLTELENRKQAILNARDGGKPEKAVEPASAWNDFTIWAKGKAKK